MIHQGPPCSPRISDCASKFKEAIDATQDKHWVDWLEEATVQDIYIVNKYISGDPGNYSKAHIPSLCTKIDGNEVLVNSNMQKATLLTDTFFPPLPTFKLFPPNTIYPEPLTATQYLSHNHIQQSIKKLKIPNIVLKKCEDLLD